VRQQLFDNDNWIKLFAYCYEMLKNGKVKNQLLQRLSARDSILGA
jgi:hypothetical protein